MWPTPRPTLGCSAGRGVLVASVLVGSSGSAGRVGRVRHHGVVAAALGPSTTSEAALADGLLAGSGRLDPSCWCWPTVAGGAPTAGAGPGNTVPRWSGGTRTGPTGPALPAERVLADGSWLAQLTAGSGEPILVRVLDDRLDDPGLAAQASGGPRPASAGMVYRLITSILDPETAPAVELAALYHQRWEIETTLDELKVHQRGPSAVLRSKTPTASAKKSGRTCWSTTPCAPCCTTPLPPMSWTRPVVVHGHAADRAPPPHHPGGLFPLTASRWPSPWPPPSSSPTSSPHADSEGSLAWSNPR
jgi:hypothetical protein